MNKDHEPPPPKHYDRIGRHCICPRKCDCADHEGYDSGEVSIACPEHNDSPACDDECKALSHWDGRPWEGTEAVSKWLEGRG